MCEASDDNAVDNDDIRLSWSFTSNADDSTENGTGADKNLAWSMLAGPCDSYCSHFVISGLYSARVDLEKVSHSPYRFSNSLRMIRACC